jgi:hypothetical protein
MAEKQKERAPKTPLPPVGVWAPVLALGWLIPGGGHFLLKHRGRAALMAFAVTGMFVFGLLMRGSMFVPQTGDLLTTIMYCGGFLGNVATGLLYLLATWLGYDQPYLAGHVRDYGSIFLVSAGLLNILGIVDAFELAIGKKT